MMTQGGIIFMICIDRETQNSKLKVSGGNLRGEPGVVANREELVELVG